MMSRIDEDTEKMIWETILLIQKSVKELTIAWSEHVENIDWLQKECDNARSGVELLKQMESESGLKNIVKEISRGKTKTGLLRNKLNIWHERNGGKNYIV